MWIRPQCIPDEHDEDDDTKSWNKIQTRQTYKYLFSFREIFLFVVVAVALVAIQYLQLLLFLLLWESFFCIAPSVAALFQWHCYYFDDDDNDDCTYLRVSFYFSSWQFLSIPWLFPAVISILKNSKIQFSTSIWHM